MVAATQTPSMSDVLQVTGEPSLAPMNLADMGIDPEQIDLTNLKTPSDEPVKDAFPEQTLSHPAAALDWKKSDSIAVHPKAVAQTHAVQTANEGTNTSLWQRMKQGVGNLFKGAPKAAPTVELTQDLKEEQEPVIALDLDILSPNPSAEAQRILEQSIQDLSIVNSIENLLEHKGRDIEAKFKVELKKWETGRSEIEQFKAILQKIHDKREENGLLLEPIAKDGKQDETHLRSLLHKMKEQKGAPEFEIKESYTKAETDKLFDKFKNRLEDCSFNSQLVMDKMKEFSTTNGELHQFMINIANAVSTMHKRFILGIAGR